MKTEWWYDDATFHYSDDTLLALARLIVREEGTAQLLTDGFETLEFATEDEAREWLTSEEYRRLDRLLEDWTEEGRSVDPRIKLPAGSSDEELARQMVIRLEPANGVAVTEQSKPQRTPTETE